MEGQTISHYRILARLGRGGMGVVYKAEDTRLKRPVALKFLPPELTRDDDARQRFVQEAQAASALDHPNVCTIHEIDTAPDGQMFLAMSYYEGETLKARLDRGPVSTEEVLDIGMQVAQGLSAAHKSGIVHRDIKPANLMLTRDGTVKILDFGIAKLSGVTGVTRTGLTPGTISYMSPEHLSGQPVDARTDVWALGVVLYQLITGELPFHADPELAVINVILNNQPPPIGERRPDAPHQFQSIVGRALKKDPNARYATAADLLRALADCRAVLTVPTTTAGVWPKLRQPQVAVPALLALVAIVAGGAWASRNGAETRWARTEAIPEVRRLIEQDRHQDAFALAVRAQAIVPQDEALAALWPRMSSNVSFETVPSGAEILLRDYGSVNREWRLLGRSPLKDVRLPQGAFRVDVRSEGYEHLETMQVFAAGDAMALKYTLQATGGVPSGMVTIPGGPLDVGFAVLGGAFPAVQGPGYFIDCYEVTNDAYRQFVNRGGYRTDIYWKVPFTQDDGRVRSWDDAMATFRDSTGQLGPATWSVQTFPEGQDKHPVSGVSWYEAAAYCQFIGKTLPTIYHWGQAASVNLAEFIGPVGNFGGKGPAPVGATDSVSRSGARDMAGNVREWVWNTSGNDRYIVGGAWGDPEYKFYEPEARSPWDRDVSNGFRCAKYGDSEPVPDALALDMPLPRRDYTRERPVSAQVFEAYKSQYLYDETALKSKVESTDEPSPNWRREKVTFDAAYDNERIAAHLFLPKSGSPPYQTVIVFPGAFGFAQSSSESLGIALPEFLLLSGRAVLYPIYKGTYERDTDELATGYAKGDRVYRNYAIKWAQDLMRSIDFLETRTDIDLTKLAFYGDSWGAQQAAIIPAIEPRLRVAVAVFGGLPMQQALPEVDSINFVTRVTIPFLLLGGQYDYVYPLEASQRPMFALLGTPAGDKRQVIYDGVGHNMRGIRGNLAIREVLTWLDKYLGPVR